MNEGTKSFVYAAILDGKGGARFTGQREAAGWNEEQGTLWLHLDFEDASIKQWLKEKSGLSELAYEALIEEGTRPRTAEMDGGLLVTLRGVNCNPGAEPDDMVAMRMWLSPNRIISMRRRRVQAAADIRDCLEKGTGPLGPGDFLVMAVDRLSDRIADIISGIEDGIDGLEEELLQQESSSLRSRLSEYRRMVIGLRRYIVPQREVMTRLQTERTSLLGDLEKLRLREIGERTARFVEDLDTVRDRAAVTLEELNTRIAERMNRTVYTMSIVATIFLPLGLLTGLLGINVGGIPGSERSWAFAAVCIIMAGIAAVEYYLFRRKNII